MKEPLYTFDMRIELSFDLKRWLPYFRTVESFSQRKNVDPFEDS